MNTWRTLPSGEIEIAGQGVPTLPDDWQRPRAKSVWAKWSSLLSSESERTGLPRAWLLAFVCIESNGEANAEGADGEAGLMQLMPEHWGGRTLEQMKDPATNVRAGADLLKQIAARSAVAGELPKVASEYNCGASASGAPHKAEGEWGMCAHGDYINAIVKTSNYGIQALGLGRPTSPASPWGPSSASSSSSSSSSTTLGGLVLLAGAGWCAWRYLR